LQFAQAGTQTKNCKRACFANADKIVFKKFTTLQKIKIHQHKARQPRQTMNRNSTFTEHTATQWTKSRQITGVWKKWWFHTPQKVLWLIKVWFSASIFVMKSQKTQNPKALSIIIPNSKNKNEQYDRR